MADTMEAPAETAAPEQQKRKPHVGRRAFLATAATVTACGAGALAAPTVIPLLESKAQEMGRDALLNEIGSLEGVSRMRRSGPRRLRARRCRFWYCRWRD